MTERITENEARLDKALACVRKLEDALAGFTANEADLQRLNEYYGSADWHADKEAFESNAIPRVKAGVLSEDAVWNLNEDISSLREAMQEVLSAAPARTDRGLWIRPYIHARDFAIIQDWIGDERTHALWSANRIAFPLTKEGFGSLLRDIAEQFGDSPLHRSRQQRKSSRFLLLLPESGHERRNAEIYNDQS